MRLLFIILIIVSAYPVSTCQDSFYDFVVKDIDGNDFAFSQLKGKKVLVVNTASKCILTPQYDALEKFYQRYKNENFIIIGFPSNNFKNEEPGTNKEIKEFCVKNYGVSFPMMSKVEVKGESIHPVYKWLTAKSLNGVRDSRVKWNFQKYLIDEKGKIIRILNPYTSVNKLKL